MSLALGATWVVFVVLWQTAGLPVAGLAGGHADVLMLIVLVWAYLRSPRQAIALAVIGGFTVDILSAHAPGVTVLALLPAAAIGGFQGIKLLDTDWVSPAILAVGSTVVFHFILLVLLNVQGGAPPLWDAMTSTVLASAVVNGLVTPLLYAFVWLASFDVRPSRRRLRTT